jgi:HEPN domain-containing protein
MTVEYLKEWIQKAEEDYEVAVTLSAKRKRLTPNAIGFHCQQCVEKYLKAFLVKNGIVYPRTHDLFELHKLCVLIDPFFSEIGDLLEEINPFAVEFRYPGIEVTMEDARRALRSMKKVRAFIQKYLIVKE